MAALQNIEWVKKGAKSERAEILKIINRLLRLYPKDAVLGYVREEVKRRETPSND